MRGLPSCPLWVYHLVGWGSPGALGLTGLLWAWLGEHPYVPAFPTISRCLYGGEHNVRVLLLCVVPMLLCWGWLVGSLVRARWYLHHKSTLTCKHTRLWNGSIFQPYFLAVLVVSWTPYIVWQLAVAAAPLKAWTALSQASRLNLALSGLYTCAMYTAIIRQRRGTLVQGISSRDVRCIHFSVGDLEDGSSEQWREAQELMIDQARRQAAVKLYPLVSAALPDGLPDSAAAKATVSILDQAEVSAEQLAAEPWLLQQEVSAWLTRSGHIAARRLTGLSDTSCGSPQVSSKEKGPTGSLPCYPCIRLSSDQSPSKQLAGSF